MRRGRPPLRPPGGGSRSARRAAALRRPLPAAGRSTSAPRRRGAVRCGTGWARRSGGAASGKGGTGAAGRQAGQGGRARCRRPPGCGFLQASAGARRGLREEGAQPCNSALFGGKAAFNYVGQWAVVHMHKF